MERNELEILQMKGEGALILLSLQMYVAYFQGSEVERIGTRLLMKSVEAGSLNLIAWKLCQPMQVDDKKEMRTTLWEKRLGAFLLVEGKKKVLTSFLE